MTLDECRRECRRLNCEDDLPLGFDIDWDPDPFHENDLNEFLYDFEFFPSSDRLFDFDIIPPPRPDKKHTKKRKHGYSCH